MHIAETIYAECPYAECPYAECPYAESPQAECRGAYQKTRKILITAESGVSRHLHLGRFRSFFIIFENVLQNRKCKRTLSHFRQDFVLQIWPSPLETAEGGKVDLAGLKATMDSSKRVLHH